MPRKPRIPPISPERQAIFDKYGEDPDMARRLHSSVYTLDRAALVQSLKRSGVKWVNPEVSGNALIERYYHFREETLQIKQRNINNTAKYSEQFSKTFGVRLQGFMSVVFGFDSCAFDKQVIKPPDGTSTYQHIERNYGPEALAMVKALMGIEEETAAVAAK